MFSCWLLLMPLACSLACFQVYKQKVKHLLYEHQENLTELKAEGTLSMKRAQKDHWAQETELRKEMRSLKVDLKEQELANEVVVKNLRLVGVWQGSRDWNLRAKCLCCRGKWWVPGVQAGDCVLWCLGEGGVGFPPDASVRCT